MSGLIRILLIVVGVVFIVTFCAIEILKNGNVLKMSTKILVSMVIDCEGLVEDVGVILFYVECLSNNLSVW